MVGGGICVCMCVAEGGSSNTKGDLQISPCQNQIRLFRIHIIKHPIWMFIAAIEIKKDIADLFYFLPRDSNRDQMQY